MEKEKFDFDDILIKPAMITEIESRQSLNIYKNDYLPLFASPMDTVVDANNAHIFNENKIIPILPRTIKEKTIQTSFGIWQAYSLSEFKDMFIGNDSIAQKTLDSGAEAIYALIDIANGHQANMHKLIIESKKQYGDKLQLMVGNVANPETYRYLSKIGADYIRVGIGNGNGCHFYGTKIKTIDGVKNIEDIIVGDKVLTHKGNYKEVEMLHFLKSDDNYQINNNKVTGNHEYYVVHEKYKNILTDDNIHEYAEWIRVDDLTKEYFLLELSECSTSE